MRDILLNWPSFGAFNMLMCSRRLKVLPLSIIVVQVVLPVCLFASYLSYNKGWCPSTGSLSQRLLMFGIALLYTVRSCLILNEKVLSEYRDEVDLRDEIAKKRRDCGIHLSALSSYGKIDNVMHIAYPALVSLLNLWFVFIADDPLDIVLDSLAMEFVGKVDDEFKVRFFAVYGHELASDILGQELHKFRQETVLFALAECIELLINLIFFVGAASGELCHDFLWCCM